MKRALRWTDKLPTEPGTYVRRRKGGGPVLVWIQKDRQSGKLYFDDYRDSGERTKCFRADWPTDRLWLGPLPKGRW